MAGSSSQVWVKAVVAVQGCTKFSISTLDTTVFVLGNWRLQFSMAEIWDLLPKGIRQWALFNGLINGTASFFFCHNQVYTVKTNVSFLTCGSASFDCPKKQHTL